MQRGTQVQTLIWEDSMCLGATKAMLAPLLTPHTLEPTLRNKRGHPREESAHRSGGHHYRITKLCTAVKTQHSQNT